VRVLCVVVDTNVLVSALISPHGAAARLLRHPVPYTLVTSAAILDELARVLRYPRLARRYHLTSVLVQDYLATLATTALVAAVDPSHRAAARGVSPDPDDDKFLACALAATADAVVSRDRHLRGLGEFAGIPILTPEQLLAFLDAQAGAD
jgi:putative PIN family toxin of toxin-antitoxin system